MPIGEYRESTTEKVTASNGGNSMMKVNLISTRFQGATQILLQKTNKNQKNDVLPMTTKCPFL